MNQKTLLGLIAVAIILIVAAVAIQHSNQPRIETAATQQKLLPDLADKVNDVDKVVITGAGNKTVATITRGKDGWNVAEKGGYTADTGKLRELLLNLADAKVLETKTSNKDKYAELGVGDVSGKDAKGMLVELDGSGKPVKLIIGAPNSRGGGTFVRHAGQAGSVLVSGRLSVPKDTSDWLAKDLADIDAKRIADVTIEHPHGSTVHVHKNAEGDADFTLMDIPKGREVVSSYTVNNVAAALAGLRLDDVVPAADAAPPDDAIKAHYAAFDGLVVDATAWSADGKDYARFKASLDSARADAHIAAAQADAKAKSDTATTTTDPGKSGKSGKPATTPATSAAAKPLAVTDPAKDRSDKLAALNKEVADLNARFDGWTFVLASYKYSAIDKSMDDLLKAPESRDAGKGKAAKKSAKSAH
jgi:hypothetical protein